MNSKQGFLITADLHLRDTVPTCRTDDFIKAQWNKMDYIAEIIKKKNLYWLDCGDLFHTAKPSYSLVNHLMYWFRSRNVQIDAAIVGNHDIPAHNLSYLDNSAWGILNTAGFIKRWLHNGIVHNFDLNGEYTIGITGVNYSENIDDFTWDETLANDTALLYHDMVFRNEKNRIADVPGLIAQELYNKVPFHTIFSGHNHQHWEWQPNENNSIQIPYEDKQGVFNVGSMTRQSADQMEHTPCCMLWDGMYRPQTLELPYRPAEQCMDRGHL